METNIWSSSIWADDKIKLILEKMIERLKGTFDAMYREGYENRVGQYKMAIDVAETLRDSEILIEEAGVGIGKSFAYLIPILLLIDEYKYNNKTLGPVIISTYSFQLQQQLLQDIRIIENMLAIDETKVNIAKGMKNYACLKMIEKRLENDNLTTRDKKILENLKTSVLNNDIDKAKGEITENLWKRISALHPNNCINCRYNATCLMPKQLKSYQNSDIIVINHAYLASLLKNKNSIIRDSSALIVDEAHALESLIRSVYEEKIKMLDVYEVLYRVLTKCVIPFSPFDTKEKSDEYYNKKTNVFEKFFIALRKGAQKYYLDNYQNQHVAFEDCNDISFKKSKQLINAREQLIDEITELLIRTKKGKDSGYGYLGINDDITFLENCLYTFKDMSKPDSNYLYWTRIFNVYNKKKKEYESKVDLVRTPKKLDKIMTELLADKPAIFTSATLTTNTLDNDVSNYSTFINSLGLMRPDVTTAIPKASPFNYSDNSLFYYTPEMPSPKISDRNEYISSLASKIDELINITEGKALVLFTNKSEMNRIYEIITKSTHSFNILLQNDSNKEWISDDFRNDINSVMFATTWEGLDVSGKSLSNVILARLPFPVSDPISEYKNTYYQDMCNHFKQGIGRLIRTSNDVGIISLLDSRFENYPNLRKILPEGMPITTDLDDVITFSDSKIKTNQPLPSASSGLNIKTLSPRMV